MKKILLVALAAAAMVGCSQNEEIENAAQKAEINFGTVVKVGTKATASTTANLTSFSVDGYKTTDIMGADVALSSSNALIQNLAVSANNGTCSFTGPLYWPATGNVQFFATSPAQSLTLPAKGYPTFNYTVGAIGTGQKDLIAASQINKTKATSKVDFAFLHLLTQVNFSIKGDLLNCVYKVTKLELLGIKEGATFKFDGTETIGDWTSLSSTNGTYEWDGSLNFTPSTNPATESVAITMADNDALFMLMPQTLASASLKITYSAQPKEAGAPTFDGIKTVALDGTWLKGKNIRYTLKLTSDATEVTFGSAVGSWTDETKPDVEPTVQP